MKLNALEDTLGVKFKNENLLKEALTHRSYLNENSSWPLPHNERLEYLGDAVLELIVTNRLFNKFPSYQEGQLTLLRAALVNYQFLAKVAQEIGLQNYLYLSRGEAKDTSRAKDVILANAFEAVVGAIYLDQGLAAAEPLVEKYIISQAEAVMKEGSYKDAKSLLQEIIQEKKRATPTYRVLSESGPDHQKTFIVGVFVGEDKLAEGEGLSKQEAELDAAKNALKKYAKTS